MKISASHILDGVLGGENYYHYYYNHLINIRVYLLHLAQGELAV